MPQAQYGPIKVPEGPPDDRFVYLSDVLPTAWQAVEYANVPEGETVLVLGLGPIGEMCHAHRAAPRRRQVIGVDLVPERLARARRARRARRSTSTSTTTSPEAVRELTGGRGPISVIDAVGMEAHGAPIGRLAHRLAGLLPDAVAQQVMETAGIDRLSALHMAIELVRRGGTVSLSGVYGGAASPMPLLQMFDKQINAAHGSGQRQALDRRDHAAARPARATRSASTTTPRTTCRSSRRRTRYEIFQKKEDGAFKILLKP